MAETGRVVLNDRMVAEVIGGIAMRATLAAANTTIERIQSNIIADGLVNTGKLLHSFDVRKAASSSDLVPRLEVFSSAPYAMFPEKGTRGSVAAPGGVLRFQPKGASSFVFAKHTGPVRAYGFMARAVQAITSSDFVGGDKYGGMFGR
jgi:hypothetical protein